MEIILWKNVFFLYFCQELPILSKIIYTLYTNISPTFTVFPISNAGALPFSKSSTMSLPPKRKQPNSSPCERWIGDL